MATPTPTPNSATTTRPERSSKRTAHTSPLGWLPWALLGLLALLVAAVLLVINAATLGIVAWLSVKLDIDSFGSAVGAGLIIAVLSWLAELVLPLRQQDDNRVRR